MIKIVESCFSVNNALLFQSYKFVFDMKFVNFIILVETRGGGICSWVGCWWSNWLSTALRFFKIYMHLFIYLSVWRSLYSRVFITANVATLDNVGSEVYTQFIITCISWFNVMMNFIFPNQSIGINRLTWGYVRWRWSRRQVVRSNDSKSSHILFACYIWSHHDIHCMGRLCQGEWFMCMYIYLYIYVYIYI